ncbi:zinc/manganese transport system permease protein [Ruminobacter amylophilus]|jgi:zinc/manganese transport system permease protein|uniref:Zinc/manganese transport system permease protein n=2 Tax=Ruminobacter TaxID=866 RepID=A0A662ZLW2_9GAMM|nr:metal ABC transporter permease [Ruminobacter amylophilus]SFP56504.1 zinc/manganese transport system permease protein [Ruminobacter amylophilus]
MFNELYNFLIHPLLSYDFMQKAFVSLVCLCFSSPLIGVFLTLKRMSLSGDAISHAILPGAAVGFMFSGLSVAAMTIGGMVAGIVVIIMSSLFSRVSKSSEESNLAVFYLFSLALGVLIISLNGSNLDLLHFLFGSIFAVGKETILLLGLCTSVTLVLLSFISRPLILDTVDPLFLASVSKSGTWVHICFMILAVFNLVSSFQAIGTLMSVGIMIIPATSAKFWSYKLSNIIAISVIFALISSYVGLVMSFHFNVPCSPAIIISLSAIYLCSFVFGGHKGIIKRFVKGKHYEN